MDNLDKRLVRLRLGILEHGSHAMEQLEHPTHRSMGSWGKLLDSHRLGICNCAEKK